MRLFCQGWGLALPPRPPTVNKSAVSPQWCVSSCHCLHKSNNCTPKCHRCSAGEILQLAMAESDFHSKSAGNRRADAKPPSEAPSSAPPAPPFHNPNTATRRSGPLRPLNSRHVDSEGGEWTDPSVGSTYKQLGQ